ncbi:Cytochrome P450 81Q32 [Linum perenne]
MADEAYWLFLCLLTFLVAIHFLSKRRQNNINRNRPPSPPSLPIIGHLHLLSDQFPYRSLHDLSSTYGGVILLRFGSRNVLVISSPSAVEECFTTNDIAFADRPQLLGGKHLNYNYTTIGACNYGQRWRNLRRLTTLELFSSSRVAAYSDSRREEAGLLLKELLVHEKGGVDLSSRFRGFAFNTMLRMVAGKRYFGYGKLESVGEEAKEFQDLIGEFVGIQGSSSPNDFFPILRWVDFQGLEKRMKCIMTKLDRFLQHLAHQQQKPQTMTTLIDVMLSLQETDPQFYTDETIKGVILVMLIAGTETASTTMEWAIALLINNPEAMNKLEAEIEEKVGVDRLLEETDIGKLSYLENVINETFRLYPPVPLLIPHESSEATKVSGFDVPKGTMLLVNAWSLQRDPELWEEPERFLPERFDESTKVQKKEKQKLVPFGAGRRACPGDVLGRKVVGLALGVVIQAFELSNIEGEGDDIDMEEGTGLTMCRANPLKVVCKPRTKAIADILMSTTS